MSAPPDSVSTLASGAHRNQNGSHCFTEYFLRPKLFNVSVEIDSVTADVIWPGH